MNRIPRLALTVGLLALGNAACAQAVAEQHLMQQLLDLPKLQPYFHVEVPGRLPLKLLRTPGMPQRLHLQKFGRPVLLLAPAKAKQQAVKDYISIRKIPARATADTLTYTLAYPVEGVLCRARFVRQSAGWVVYNYSIVEQ
ncbi:hypothetical protein KBK19_15550 [Microvirga sp. STR05]|uniref:DUF4348 domain-containing protein n=1 Tax=Hymenobacter duratus TaxID=2771356 RepID=A0ABR8JL46_9BACT|nr:hypothetical protein [Hymenobacter duratus]MBD2716456.1 hypothetical protein [Hymenobacter duratus]MBR7951371.1 hypothetical protein [Microvirga sp. STR05]